MKPQWSKICTAKIVGLKTFIKAIPIVDAGSDVINYDTKINDTITETVSDPSSEPGLSPPAYRRSTACLIKADMESVATAGIVDILDYRYTYLMSPAAFFEELVMESVFRYGKPTYLVRVGRRKWMAADPQDYRIYRHGDRYVLVCLYEYRASAIEMLKVETNRSGKPVLE